MQRKKALELHLGDDGLPPIAELRGFIREGVEEQEIAHEIGISLGTLSEKIKRRTGRTFRQLKVEVTHEILPRVKDMITGGKTANEIAESFGFDAEHFATRLRLADTGYMQLRQEATDDYLQALNYRVNTYLKRHDQSTPPYARQRWVHDGLERNTDKMEATYHRLVEGKTVADIALEGVASKSTVIGFKKIVLPDVLLTRRVQAMHIMGLLRAPFITTQELSSYQHSAVEGLPQKEAAAQMGIDQTLVSAVNRLVAGKVPALRRLLAVVPVTEDDVARMQPLTRVHSESMTAVEGILAVSKFRGCSDAVREVCAVSQVPQKTAKEALKALSEADEQMRKTDFPQRYREPALEAIASTPVFAARAVESVGKLAELAAKVDEVVADLGTPKEYGLALFSELAHPGCFSTEPVDGRYVNDESVRQGVEEVNSTIIRSRRWYEELDAPSQWMNVPQETRSLTELALRINQYIRTQSKIPEGTEQAWVERRGNLLGDIPLTEFRNVFFEVMDAKSPQTIAAERGMPTHVIQTIRGVILPEVEAQRRLEAEAVAQILNESDLADRYKKVFELIAVEGKTDGEAAEIMGYARNSVNNIRRELRNNVPILCRYLRVMHISEGAKQQRQESKETHRRQKENALAEAEQTAGEEMERVGFLPQYRGEALRTLQSYRNFYDDPKKAVAALSEIALVVEEESNRRKIPPGFRRTLFHAIATPAYVTKGNGANTKQVIQRIGEINGGRIVIEEYLEQVNAPPECQRMIAARLAPLKTLEPAEVMQRARDYALAYTRIFDVMVHDHHPEVIAKYIALSSMFSPKPWVQWPKNLQSQLNIESKTVKRLGYVENSGLDDDKFMHLLRRFQQGEDAVGIEVITAINDLVERGLGTANVRLALQPKHQRPVRLTYEDRMLQRIGDVLSLLNHPPQGLLDHEPLRNAVTYLSYLFKLRDIDHARELKQKPLYISELVFDDTNEWERF